jgi:hypothetical protein
MCLPTTARHDDHLGRLARTSDPCDSRSERSFAGVAMTGRWGLSNTRPLPRQSREKADAMEPLWQDVRYACRTIRKNPGFAAVAVLSLALGVGANTTIFTLLNAALLAPLPVERPSELVAV